MRLSGKVKEARLFYLSDRAHGLAVRESEHEGRYRGGRQADRGRAAGALARDPRRNHTICTMCHLSLDISLRSGALLANAMTCGELKTSCAPSYLPENTSPFFICSMAP